MRPRWTYYGPLCFTVLLLTGLPDVLLAQMRQETAATEPVLLAHPVQSPIAVDGRLDEAAWQEAQEASDFMQSEPHEGAPATQKTRVRVLYGPNNVYVGAQLFDDEASQIQPTLGRRDEMNRADWFVVSIDSYFDRKTAYVFAVNAAGVQFDAIQTGGGGPGGGMDESWDAIWASSARVASEGWIVEMRIPYSMLRFAEAEGQTWGIHFTRRIPRLGEEAQWPLVRRTERANRVAQYGRLQGLSDIEPRRNLQVSPYTVSRLLTEENPDQPGELIRDGSVDLGGDLKIGLSPNVTLDATINPDFGQVEADPAELNLTAFETFFEERRPFFVEGIQIYEFDIGRGSDLLYTRRIGAEAPIVGATKLSGRTAGGLSFGVLGAATGENFGPERHYGVARLSQQLGAFSSVGGILTGFEGPGEEIGRRSALTGGMDWDVRFFGNTYSLEGFAIFSHRRGVEDDQDPQTGLAASLRGARRQGTWTYDVTANLYDHGFNPNDLGRLRRNDYMSLGGGIDHEVNGGQPFGPFQRAFIGFNAGQEWSYRDRLNLGMDARLFTFWTLQGFQRIFIRTSLERPFGGYDLFETRGLGPRAQPTSLDVSGSFATDERRAWQLEPQVNLTLQDDGGRVYGLGLEANWNLGSRLTLMGEVETRWEDDAIAWSSNEAFARGEDAWRIGADAESPDDLGPDDYAPFDDRGLLDGLLDGVAPFDDAGHYYVPVFGVRDTRSVDVTVRSTVTFTPTLSLQLYGQLFVARGRYGRFQILHDPDTLVPFDAFPKRDAFAFSSFQANTVLRWEYRPGSVLYLVWTQGRRADDELNPLAPWGASPYDTPMDRQIADTFRIIPSNVFLVKLSYTFLR